jgi:GDP-D-mannose 3', 5'-epimerase
MTQRTALVTGAGGFIGHHLVKYLQGLGCQVHGADIKAPEYEETTAEEFELVDLREWESCLKATRDVDEVYQLAADMGASATSPPSTPTSPATTC